MLLQHILRIELVINMTQSFVYKHTLLSHQRCLQLRAALHRYVCNDNMDRTIGIEP